MTGIKKAKELFANVLNLFRQELRDSYLMTVLEQVNMQV
jgi:hypothetical protein